MLYSLVQQSNDPAKTKRGRPGQLKNLVQKHERGCEHFYLSAPNSMQYFHYFFLFAPTLGRDEKYHGIMCNQPANKTLRDSILLVYPTLVIFTQPNSDKYFIDFFSPHFNNIFFCFQKQNSKMWEKEENFYV